MDKKIRIHPLEIPRVMHPKMWEVLGWVFMVVSLPFMYSYFFERQYYLTRKTLLKYLRENELPTLNELSISYGWTIKNIKINYWKNDNTWSVHNGSNCILAPFYGGYFSKKHYMEIKAILEEAIRKEARNVT